MKYRIYIAKDANFNIGLKCFTVCGSTESEATDMALRLKKSYGLRFHQVLSV